MNFCVLGGDKRQIYLIKSLYKDGHKVYAVGFEKCNDIKDSSNLDFAIKKSDYIILPIPISRDKTSINAPFSKEKIMINKDLYKKIQSKIIFCGGKYSLISAYKDFNSCKIYDYSKKEVFEKENAVPSAEGAIQIAINEYSGTINKSNCLVAGYGRIGKVLSNMLSALGANVSVSARKEKDIELIKKLNYTPMLTSEIYEESGYDIIFNTIPHLIFDSKTLKNTAKNAIIIDLASSPGGVDKKAAKQLNIKVIHALGLPGKIAPKTSGEIIKNSIYNIMKEENL